MRTRINIPALSALTLPLAVALALASCSSAPRPETGDATLQRMITHFDAALELRDHAISGDLTRFRAAARALADLETSGDLPPEVFLQFGPLRYEAEVGAGARTRQAAALAAAEVARTCGDCHTANGLALPDEAPIPAASQRADVRAHMERLSRVTRQLWAGLVAPSEEDWQAGAAGLIEAGGLPSGLEPLVPTDDLAFASRRMVRLAEEAADADAPAYRVRALGEIWATCADCHAAFSGDLR